MTLDPSQGIAVFTDGSCSHKDKSGGWAYVALDAFEGMATASGWFSGTTISQMELRAPIVALFALADQFGACDVLVYSDSEYVVLGATDRTRKRNKNKGWWEELDTAIAEHNRVEFYHVRGHSDHLFNEMADQLAGEARKKGQQSNDT